MARAPGNWYDAAVTMNNDDLKSAKSASRTMVNEALARTTPEERNTWSSRIRTHLTGMDAWKMATEVLLYSPMKVEVDTIALARDASAAGKDVFLPRLHGDVMRFHAMTSEPMEAHSYGMLEPPQDAPPWPVKTDRGAETAAADRRVLVVCPGLAFDRSGRRLGRGKAFYDRFIQSLEAARIRDRVVLVGICFGIQLLDEVPAGPDDRLVDAVVTEDGTVSVSHR